MKYFYFETQARIQYDPPRPDKFSRGADWWVVAHVDREITRYMRWWIDHELRNPLGFEKYDLCVPSFNAHVSVIRGINDVRHNMKRVKELWKKYDGQKATIQYAFAPYRCPIGFDRSATNERCWAVRVKSDKLLNIRREMGLPSQWNLHLTVGREYVDRHNVFMEKILKV